MTRMMTGGGRKMLRMVKEEKREEKGEDKKDGRTRQEWRNEKR
jgi:hypothetical protein